MNAEYVVSDVSHVLQRKQSRLSRRRGLNEYEEIYSPARNTCTGARPSLTELLREAERWDQVR